MAVIWCYKTNCNFSKNAIRTVIFFKFWFVNNMYSKTKQKRNQYKLLFGIKQYFVFFLFLEFTTSTQCIHHLFRVDTPSTLITSWKNSNCTDKILCHRCDSYPRFQVLFLSREIMPLITELSELLGIVTEAISAVFWWCSWDNI